MALLTRWEPFGSLQQDMARLQREMGSWFNRLGSGGRAWMDQTYAYPALNLWEDENFLYAEAELPGLKMDDLEISVTGEEQLTLKGERKQAASENVAWHRQEREYGSFERVVRLPVSVDPNGVEARFEYGVLMIKMAKSPKAKPRKIPVVAE